LETESGGLLGQAQELSLSRTFFHSGKCAFFIWLPGSDEVIQDSCEFVGSGGDSWGSAQPNAHASEILSKVGLAPMEGLRRHAERDGQAVFHFSRDDGQHSTTADSVIGAETEPGSKGGGIGKPAQVRAHLSQQRVSSQATHTWDCGQVNAEDAIQLRAQIEARLISSRLVMISGLG